MMAQRALTVTSHAYLAKEEHGQGVRRARAGRGSGRGRTIDVLATAYSLRFIIFGSFVTAKRKPNDVDIFMLNW